MNQRLIIFDLDGTLIDSAAVMVESAVKAFEEAGIAPPDDVAIRSVSGLGLSEGLSRLAPEADAAAIALIAKGYRAAYNDAVAAGLREPLFAGARETLDRLAARDDTVLVVATGKALRGARRVLALHGIDHMFLGVHTPDEYAAKPDPDMIYAAMALTDVKPQATIMIGDTNHDMEMAVAAGVRALGVSWGYHEADNLHTAGADRVIDAFSEMETALEEMLGKAYA